MGSKCKREILRGETYGAAIMLIRLGYDMAFSEANCDGAEAVPPSLAGIDD